MNPTPAIALSDLDWQTQEEILTAAKANPRLVVYACRMALTPARPWHTIFAHTPEEYECIAKMPGFSRVVGIPIQKPAHRHAETFFPDQDGTFHIKFAFGIGERVMLRDGAAMRTVTNYTFDACPKSGALTVQYMTEFGEFYADEAISALGLDPCPECNEQGVYADHCAECGWDIDDTLEDESPALTAAERNGHSIPVWK